MSKTWRWCIMMDSNSDFNSMHLWNKNHWFHLYLCAKSSMMKGGERLLGHERLFEWIWYILYLDETFRIRSQSTKEFFRLGVSLRSASEPGAFIWWNMLGIFQLIVSLLVVWCSCIENWKKKTWIFPFGSCWNGVNEIRRLDQSLNDLLYD